MEYFKFAVSQFIRTDIYISCELKQNNALLSSCIIMLEVPMNALLAC